jgi:DNA sulfur modification protein DndB
MVKELIEDVKIFNGLTDTEKSAISNRSIKLFTLSGIYHATEELLADKRDLEILLQSKIAIEFWNEVSKYIEEWQLVRERKISSAELRADYICAHAVALIGLGSAGRALLNQYPDKWKLKIKKIKEIDWHRNNRQQWEGRVTIGGRISNTRNNVVLLSNEIKRVLGLELNDEEQGAERAFIGK